MSYFQPSLIFVNNTVAPLVWQSLSLIYKSKTRLNFFVRDKDSSLLCTSFCVEVFYSIDNSLKMANFHSGKKYIDLIYENKLTYLSTRLTRTVVFLKTFVSFLYIFSICAQLYKNLFFVICKFRLLASVCYRQTLAV